MSPCPLSLGLGQDLLDLGYEFLPLRLPVGKQVALFFRAETGVLDAVVAAELEVLQIEFLSQGANVEIEAHADVVEEGRVIG